MCNASIAHGGTRVTFFAPAICVKKLCGASKWAWVVTPPGPPTHRYLWRKERRKERHEESHTGVFSK